MESKVEIAASLLAADFAHLAKELSILEQCSDVKWIHFDIMDGHFVPNLTFGPQVVKSLRKYSTKKFDVHLMVQNPADYFEQLAGAGADMVSFHVEAVTHHDKLLSRLKELGLKAGIALNPSTPLHTLEYLLPKLDMVLVMSVNPGFGGQSFIPHMVQKVQHLRALLVERGLQERVSIGVDGGVNEQTSELLRESGAHLLVAGSYLLQDLKSELSESTSAFPNHQALEANKEQDVKQLIKNDYLSHFSAILTASLPEKDDSKVTHINNRAKILKGL